MVEAGAVGGDRCLLQALLAIEFAARVLGFSHAVGHQDDAVAGIERDRHAAVFGHGEQTHGQVPFLHRLRLAVGDHQRRHVTAVEDLRHAVR